MTLTKRRRSTISSKKGNVVLNSILFLIVIFVFAFVVLFGGHIFQSINTDILNDLTLNESKEAFQEVETRYPSFFDNIIVLILAGLIVAGIVAAIFSDNHPIIFGFLMFLIVAVLIVAGIFANFYEDFFADAEYGSLTASFPKLTFIMTHLVEVAVFMALSIILALMAKNRA